MPEDLKSPSTLPSPYDRLCFARILVGSLHVSISLLKQIASFIALTHAKEEEAQKKGQQLTILEHHFNSPF